MTSMRRLVGLPVVAGGKQMGHVVSAVLTPNGEMLSGLVIRSGIRGAKWISATDIALLGDVSVISRGKPSRIPKGADFSLRRVRDTTGARLGVVTDVLLYERSLRVSALEISNGPLDDLKTGRFFATAFSVSAAGDGRTGEVTIPCPSESEVIEQ